jgi:hypothetical protein
MRDRVTVDGTDAPTSLAVAASKTHVFLARGTPGALALGAYALAAPSTEIKPAAFMLPSLAKWSGQNLAMAAANGVVLVAWTSNASGNASSVGGYALFSCAEK